MSHRAALVALAVLAIGCGPSEAERAARAADSIVAIADSGGNVFRGTVNGSRVAIMVHDCKVFNLADPPRIDGQRPVILKPEFYPWPTACMRQSVEGDSAWVTVTLGRQCVGAGGCCATGGTYRSRDGRAWEREGAGGKWTRVGEDSTRAP